MTYNRISMANERVLNIGRQRNNYVYNAFLKIALLKTLGNPLQHVRGRELVTVNIHSPKKAPPPPPPSTYLLANKHSPVLFSRDKKTPRTVCLPINKYCLGKYLLPFSYSVSIIGHNSHRFTPKPSLRQIKSKFSPK